MNKKTKCSICHKEVESDRPWNINAAVIGEPIPLMGHETCLSNVDQIVVIENRWRFNSFIEHLRKKLMEAQGLNDKLDDLLSASIVAEMLKPGSTPKA